MIKIIFYYISTIRYYILYTIYRNTPQDNSLNINKNENITPQVTPQVIRVYGAVGDKALTKQQIMNILGLEDRENFRLNYLQPALAVGLLEMTIPDKPTSKNQKYRKSVT